MLGKSGEQSDLRFGVLGSVAVWRGETDIAIGTAKHVHLLGALLLHPNERVDRDTIIDVVWEGRPPRSAVNLVQKYVGELRQALGAQAGALRSIAGSYRLDVPPTNLDSAVFVELVDRGRAEFAAGHQAAAQEHLRAALALWRGQPFDGMDAQLLGAERARLADARYAAWADLADIMLANGEHEPAAAELARLTAEAPFRERLRELQMLALYRQGRRAEALAVFTSVRARLADELGIDPGLGLRRRYEQILRDDPALEPLAATEPAAEPLPVRQLPFDVPDFVGRAQPLDAISRLLADSGGGPQVVVVVGGPGVGKSSLALHAAHLASAGFPDGQLYFNLAGMSESPSQPAQILAEALRALSVAGLAIPDSLAERAALYRSLLADRRMLVVLDDVGSVGQVLPLLPAAGGCAALLTSRALLTELPGARHIDLDVLTDDEAHDLLTGIVGAARVNAEPVAAQQILRRCGNLPLAIRLAGARLVGRPAWPLALLRDRLDDESRRLAELRVGDLGVRASVELSLRTLPPDAAAAFALLGLLGPVGFPGWVLGPLLDRVDADDVLERLVDANLVRLTCTDAVGQPRYRLHDLIRTCAVQTAARIPLARQREALARVLATLLDLAERAAARLPASLFTVPPGPAPRRSLPHPVARRLIADPLGWFDAERENLLDAVKLAADWGLAELAWELAASAVPYLDHKCLYLDWQHSHQLALEAAEAAGNAHGTAVMLRGLGQLHIYRDEFDEATRSLERSLAHSRDRADRFGEALAIAVLGTVSRAQNHYDDALSRVEQALAIATAEGNRQLRAQLSTSLGAIRLSQGQLAAAEPWFGTALAQARDLDDPHRVAVVQRSLSRLHDRRGDHQAALDCLRQALDTFDELADERCAAYTQLEIGRVYAGQGQRARAVRALEHAASVFQRHGDRQDEAKCWQLLGELDAATGTGDQARLHLGRALRLWQATGAVAQTVMVLAALRALRR